MCVTVFLQSTSHILDPRTSPLWFFVVFFFFFSLHNLPLHPWQLMADWSPVSTCPFGHHGNHIINMRRAGHCKGRQEAWVELRRRNCHMMVAGFFVPRVDESHSIYAKRRCINVCCHPVALPQSRFCWLHTSGHVSHFYAKAMFRAVAIAAWLCSALSHIG